MNEPRHPIDMPVFDDNAGGGNANTEGGEEKQEMMILLMEEMIPMVKIQTVMKYSIWPSMAFL